MLTGRCECRRVRFEVDGEILDFSHCHCSQCRRLHGAAYATFAGVARDAFRYESGENDITVYASSARNNRIFCSVCGSTILVEPGDEPDMLYLSMSAVDGDPRRPAGYHQYAASRAPWHDITDDLDRYETDAPA